MVELSQLSFWRKLLFEAEFGEKFAIDSKTTEGIPEELQKLLRRYQDGKILCYLKLKHLNFLVLALSVPTIQKLFEIASLLNVRCLNEVPN